MKKWNRLSKSSKIVCIFSLILSLVLLSGCISNLFGDKNLIDGIFDVFPVDSSEPDVSSDSLINTDSTADSETYEYPVSLITFKIDGVEYAAEEGMAWYYWCSSIYNTAGYKVSNSLIESSDGTRKLTYTSGEVVTMYNIIISGKNYLTQEESVVSKITFKIDGVLYTADQGMNWEDFINSSYNSGLGLYDYNGYVVKGEAASIHQCLCYSELGGDVFISDVVSVKAMINPGVDYCIADFEFPVD